MNKKILLFRPAFYTLIAVCVLQTVVSAAGDRNLFFLSAAITGAGLVYTLFQLSSARKDIEGFLESMGHTVSEVQTASIIHLPMPVYVVSALGEVMWYNPKAAEMFPETESLYGHSARALLGDFDFIAPCPEHGHNVTVGERAYSVYVNRTTEEGEEPLYALYLVEDTELKHYTDEYFRTRATVMIVTIDNYDELVQMAKESDRSQILSEIEYQLDQYVERCHGRIDQVEKDRFIVSIEDQHLQQMVDSRFDILDTIRGLSGNERMPTTLSIGVGRGAKDLRDSEELARQALDMALGRGGDQAAVRTENGYDFYGGVSKGVEKRTKVKTRIVATALAELIDSCENVILMGHRFADLDAFGSAVALYRAVVQMGKPAVIAIDRHRNLVQDSLEELEQNGYAGVFQNPVDLMDRVTPKTLLIIVDTHTENIVESADLYHRCENVVVIDHHRKMVGHIDNAVIFYHEPYASSASEMVTELVQYFGERVRLGRQEAEALLAGIMLDTKNFILRAGVRTFEAAAYLRRMGAETVEVRKLFSSSMDAYQRRSRLVSSAELYRRCAIAGSNNAGEDMKIVAAQAADELLNISGVDASFVLFEEGTGTSISARSMGAVNVQLIMEELHGGGHQTMAASQMPGIAFEDARQQLLQAIDHYMETLHPHP